MMLIESTELSKVYGSRVVVNQLSFSLEPGKITGFLGPNGSGKSTTMSMMLGLVQGKGETLVDGHSYRTLSDSPRRIGAYLGPGSFHPRHTVKEHLRISAFTRGIRPSRVGEVLDLVGLSSASSIRVKGMSTGMMQKLGIATALLSEPEVLILDEPANGLDPQSVQWLRSFLQDFAKSGNTVLLSSHLIHEIAQFADNLLVIAQGELIASESLDAFLKRQKPSGFRVRTSRVEIFADLLNSNNFSSSRVSEDVIEIHSESSTSFIKLALENGIEIHELQPVGSNLEDIFLELTSGRSDYVGVEPSVSSDTKGMSNA
jgi:ABC-2 type transport system ATP-binding protein